MTDSQKDSPSSPSDPNRSSESPTPGSPAPNDPTPQRPEGGTQIDGPSRDTLSTARPAEFSYLGPPEGPDEIGRLSGYRVLRIVGRGGMGVVFEAEDPLLGRHVAVKVPLTQASDDVYRQRFLREARIAATLTSDHIATVYQAGLQEGVPFLVMEMLRGETLESQLGRYKTLAVLDALRIAREVAIGLREAHARGLVHRDIKPANIWLEDREGQSVRRVKILDFGVARASSGQAGITRAGQIVGSLGYMAPEQVCGGSLDGRTDLFALGCVIYEMLIGRLPFQGTDTIAALKAIVHETPEAAAKTAPHLPASVCRLLDDLLQKERTARPASAEVVIERIQQIERELSRQQTAAGDSRLLPADAKISKTSWGMLFGAGAVVIALVVGLFVLARNLGGRLPQSDAAGPQAAGFSGEPIKVGILHSITGPLSSTETPVAEAAILAIEEINKAGGVLGRPVEFILEDGRSTEEGFAAGAEKLVLKDKVAAIFGCWTSSARKRVEAVCKDHDNMLVYPINYEGLEESPYVVYVGGAPNQQLLPAVSWAIGMGKRRFFLVGSSYIYSYACNAIIRDQLKDKKAECVGEAYVPLQQVTSVKFTEIAAQIKKSGADGILSTVDGHQANVSFFHALSEAKIRSEDCPVFSFAFYESELRNLDEQDSKGHYAVANYFESMRNPENIAFLKRFRARHSTRVANDPIVAAYSGVYLWKQAVEQNNDISPAAVRTAMVHQKFDGPEGALAIDPANRHAIRTARIGQVVSNREFKVVFVSPEPIMPVPFPPSRTRREWEDFLQGLYRDWGNRWEAPGN